MYKNNKFIYISIISLICIIFIKCCWAEQAITLGLISDRYYHEMSTTFEEAIKVANDNLREELANVSLNNINDKVDYGDSFQAYGKLCHILENGVGGIFGPSSKYTATHLMTICDAKDLPYFYPQLSENSDGFNLYPHPLDIARALYSILNAFKWSRFVFLYESAEYLCILNDIINRYGNNGPIITVLRYDIEMNGNYKPVLRRIRKSGDNRIVIAGSTDTVQELLRQAQQVGIINEDYTYIVGNLDFHSFDLEEYKYSETNITSIRMFSPAQKPVRDLMKKLTSEEDDSLEENIRNGSCPITLEMALTYDAVQLFAETAKRIPFSPTPLNCSESVILDGSETKSSIPSETRDGSTFKNYMRSMDLQERTLTGRIYFEGNVRKGYSLEVVELQPSGIVSVGTWDFERDYVPRRMAQTNSLVENIDNTLANKTFTVLLSVPNKPYASLVESYKKLDGNSQFEGYGVDLIKELALKLGFNFTLTNGGNDYGSFNKTTNVSTGMLKEIMEGRADLAVTDLTITAEREEAVDFSIPFMNLGIAILYIQPQKVAPALFSFMDPFSSEVWIYLGVSFLGVSFSFFILGRLSPVEWDNPYPCVEEPSELENQFTISNAFWFTTGALLQQGSEIGPKALSTRTVAAFWLFFTLLMVSSYTANMAAFLTVESPVAIINNVEELAENKGGVRYGAKKTGSTRNFFLFSDSTPQRIAAALCKTQHNKNKTRSVLHNSATSKEEPYIKMNEYLTKNEDLLTETNQEGVDRVINSNTYAFLMESTSIEYNTMRECNLTKVGDALDQKTYGIAMPKNWPYRDKFNNALLELQEQGVLAKMKNKWWNEVGAGLCTSKSQTSEAAELKMNHVAGIYLVLVVGSVFSLLYGVVSWILFVISKARHYHVPLKDAFIEEFKFVLDFNSYTRILKSSASVYSRSRNSSIIMDSISDM